MNIDLLPFSAFALESSGAAANDVSEGQTLTLGLELALAQRPGAAPMHGTISLEPAAPAPLQVLRACVVPAPDTAITLTF